MRSAIIAATLIAGASAFGTSLRHHEQAFSSWRSVGFRVASMAERRSNFLSPLTSTRQR